MSKSGHRWNGCGKTQRCVRCGVTSEMRERPAPWDGRCYRVFLVGVGWTRERPECEPSGEMGRAR